eukprot:Gb_22588 [translate_table: standard]
MLNSTSQPFSNCFWNSALTVTSLVIKVFSQLDMLQADGSPNPGKEAESSKAVARNPIEDDSFLHSSVAKLKFSRVNCTSKVHSEFSKLCNAFEHETDLVFNTLSIRH